MLGQDRRTRPTRIVVYSVFFLSGAAALGYELSWSRQVGLVVGQTAGSFALVLSAFFTGQAIGQAVGSRVACRVTPLVGYGVAELFAAAWACLIPELIGGIDAIPHLGSGASFDAGLRKALCFLVLLPATIPLGATLPLMASFVSPPSRPAGREIAFAYALNTAGAVAGVVAATLSMAPVGVRAIGFVAAASSATCGAASLLISRTSVAAEEPSTDYAVPDASAEVASAGRAEWFAVAAVSGFVTLALEVLYTRLFSLVFHNSTYTFAAVLVVFLAGLSLGAAVVALLSRRYPPRALAIVASGAGSLATAASLFLFVQLTELQYFTVGDSFSAYLIGVLGLVGVVVLPPVTLLGMALPAAFLTCGADSGRGTGRLAAVNTVAAACGAVSAGFVWVPVLSLWGAFAGISLLAGTAGVALLVRARRSGLAVAFAVVGAAAAVAVTTAPSQGPAPRPSRRETIVRRWESDYGWIDVVRETSSGSLKVRQNLHYRHGSTGADVVREYRQGLLPLLLHDGPSDVAFLGLGTGITASPSVADPAVGRAVVVELIPEVAEAARILREANLGVVDDAKVEIRIDDARHYLRRTDRRFDVIVSDLFVPWESRTGYLYTTEHFEAVRRRLKPGGIFCQWVALYQVGPKEFELIADSFASVFPETTLWWGRLDPQSGMLAIVGSGQPLKPDAAAMERRLRVHAARRGSEDPSLAGIESLAELYAGRWPRRAGRRLNTDEHPYVEFDAPSAHRDGATLRGAALRRYFDEVLMRLPAGGVRFASLARETGADERRAMQRLVLFGSVHGR